MKEDCLKNWCSLALLVFYCGLVNQVSAQSFRTLYSFSSSGIEGARPFAGLVSSGNTLYGTTIIGGSASDGTVFKVNTDGTGFTTLYSFTPLNGSVGTNIDGANPWASLILSNNTLYGTTDAGGMSGSGTLFAVGIDGTAFNSIHSFTPFGYPVFVTNSDGANSKAHLTLSGETLYGTTTWGGSSGDGVVFSVQTDGSSFSVLHNFSWSDGAIPATGVLVSDNVLYGTTGNGVSGTPFEGYGSGGIFRLNTDGTGFTNLHNFTPLSPAPDYTNSDGASPSVGLILVNNILYGAAGRGGSWGCGTVFRLNVDGTEFTNLYNFGGYPNEGNNPNGLVLMDGTLYGTAYTGGSSNVGTVFSLSLDGSGFTTLHSFSGGIDGSYPTGVILSSNTLYGTTITGGDATAYYDGGYGSGTIFSISFPPKLSIVSSGSNLVLSWPTNYVGFDYSGYTLQSTTNLASPVWTTNLPPPVIVNGQYTVTNPISGTQQYFRLSQ